MLFKRIRELREYEAYTMQEVADKLKVSKSTYSLWEYGKDVIPLPRMIKLANIYRVKLDYLLGLTDDKENKYLYDPINLTVLGNNLKNLRLRLKQTQKEFAKNINTSKSSRSNYERGETLITILPLYEICRYAHISAEKLIYNNDNNF